MTLQKVQEAAREAVEAVERLIELTGAYRFERKQDGKICCQIRLADLAKITTKLAKEDWTYSKEFCAEFSATLGGVNFLALATAEEAKRLEEQRGGG